MTFILVISCLLVAFILLLRYDIHKHKYRDGFDKPTESVEAPTDESKQKKSKKQN